MKKLLNKKFISCILITMLLITMAISVAARYGMGGTAVKDGNNNTIGNGYLWNDQNTLWTLSGETTSSLYNNVKVQLSIGYTESSTGNLKYISGPTYSDNDGYISTSIYMNPSYGSPLFGMGTFTVNGYEAIYSNAW